MSTFALRAGSLVMDSISGGMYCTVPRDCVEITSRVVSCVCPGVRTWMCTYLRRALYALLLDARSGTRAVHSLESSRCLPKSDQLRLGSPELGQIWVGVANLVPPTRSKSGQF